MITSQTIKDIAPVLAVIATVVGATWVMLGEISESRVEFHKGMSEIRVVIHEENAKTRDELRKENAKTRENVKIIETKIDEFKDFYEREHNLFYGQGG